MVCPRCRKELPDGSLFCGYCGYSMQGDTPQATDTKPRFKGWWWIVLSAVVLTAAIGIGVWLLLRGAAKEPDAPPVQEDEISAYAMLVNDTEIPKELYSAWLYTIFYEAYYNGGLYQYEQYGMDPWDQTFPYGEGEDAEDLLVGDYLVQITKDSIVRAEAVRQWAQESGIAPSDEELAELDEDFARYREEEMLPYGFGKEAYRDVYIDRNMYEQALFYGLYNKGGARAPEEADVREFYDNNVIAYYRIGEEDTDQTLTALLADYHKGKDIFAGAEAEFDNTVIGDIAWIRDVQAMAVGEAKMLTSEDDGNVLVLRLDPTAADPAHYEDSRETVVYGMCFEEFDDEVVARVEAMTVEYNDPLLDEIRPEEFPKIAKAESDKKYRESLKELNGAVLTFRDEEGNVLLTRADVREACVVTDEDTMQKNVEIRFTADGAKRLEDATRKLLGKSLCICFDGTTLLAPTVLEVNTDGVATVRFSDPEEAAIYADLFNNAT